MTKTYLIALITFTFLVSCKKESKEIKENYIPINSPTLIEAYFENILETNQTRPFNGSIYMQ